MIEEIYSGMKHYIFADTENSASDIPHFIDFLNSNNYLSADSQIICIIGGDKGQNNYYENLKSKIGNKHSSNLTPIRITDISKNAVDMVLVTYLGIAISRNPFADFIIVSNDNDYSPVIKIFSDKGLRLSVQKITNETKLKLTKAAKNEKKSIPKNKASELSETQIKEIAIKIYSQKSSRPTKVKTLRKRVNQCKTKYKFTEKDLDYVFEKVKEYLLSAEKIVLDNDKIIWA